MCTPAFTANLDSPLEARLAHRRTIVSHLLPGGVISHRPAFEDKPHKDSLVITRGKTRRNLELPVLTVRVVPGAGPRRDPPANDVPYGALHLSSDPRRYLENLTRGRGWSRRVLLQQTVEGSLDRVLMIGDEHRLNQSCEQARQIAVVLGYQAQFERGLVGALLGTQQARKLTAK